MKKSGLLLFLSVIALSSCATKQPSPCLTEEPCYSSQNSVWEIQCDKQKLWYINSERLPLEEEVKLCHLE